MTDPTFENLMMNLNHTNVQLKVLDLYSNNLTDKSIHFLTNFLKEYRHVESWGFGGNHFSSIKAFDQFFDSCGKTEIS